MFCSEVIWPIWICNWACYSVNMLLCCSVITQSKVVPCWTSQAWFHRNGREVPNDPTNTTNINDKGASILRNDVRLKINNNIVRKNISTVIHTWTFTIRMHSIAKRRNDGIHNSVNKLILKVIAHMECSGPFIHFIVMSLSATHNKCRLILPSV